MSEAHVCNFTFEKNVMHIHVQHAAPGAQQATSRKAGKYVCSCGAFDLRDPVEPKVQHLPSDDSEGGTI